ncbi:SIMPL domain-containing protein [Paenibacillus sp. PR3]|uniref:SIMPL domain-containing protein n=1 Tax=Paenibacillus terricola TaxID=2763503 RepID=A0ABR8N2G6_9BACL|nr:SIMPL domain-containing protein [Paenibacillus terricola]MBD3922359.1 SIMPL domain-containing protein [Paenibacillus terricola]
MTSYGQEHGLDQGRSTIEVQGEGQVTAAPDQAVITLGVATEKEELRTAQADNAAAIARIIQSIRQLNVPQEQIQTIEYRIDTHYDYIDGKQIFRGYQVTHMLQITTNNVGQAGTIVDTAVENGANHIGGIRYSVAQPAYYEKQALSLAVRNAMDKALTIAHTMGITIDVVPTRVQELSQSGFTPMPLASAAMKVSDATPLQPGQLTITASVRAWFRQR